MVIIKEDIIDPFFLEQFANKFFSRVKINILSFEYRMVDTWNLGVL